MRCVVNDPTGTTELLPIERCGRVTNSDAVQIPLTQHRQVLVFQCDLREVTLIILGALAKLSGGLDSASGRSSVDGYSTETSLNSATRHSRRVGIVCSARE